MSTAAHAPWMDAGSYSKRASVSRNSVFDTALCWLWLLWIIYWDGGGRAKARKFCLFRHWHKTKATHWHETENFASISVAAMARQRTNCSNQRGNFFAVNTAMTEDNVNNQPSYIIILLNRCHDTRAFAPTRLFGTIKKVLMLFAVRLQAGCHAPCIRNFVFEPTESQRGEWVHVPCTQNKRQSENHKEMIKSERTAHSDFNSLAQQAHASKCYLKLKKSA